MPEFTDREKAILKVMFRNMRNIIETCGGSIDIDYDSFTRDDLYALFLKLGIGDFYDY